MIATQRNPAATSISFFRELEGRNYFKCPDGVQSAYGRVKLGRSRCSGGFDERNRLDYRCVGCSFYSLLEKVARNDKK